MVVSARKIPTEFEIISVEKQSRHLVEQFVRTAGKSLRSFRYFDSRNLSVLDDHHVTLLSLFEGMPVSYGHLDWDGTRTWLGIAVSEQFLGQGLGKKMMAALFKQAKQKQLFPIYLSVDYDNLVAIGLYQKLGFSEIERRKHCLIMEKREL